jgi:Flp pilus assembly protein TadG
MRCFLRDERGAAAIEYAFVLPALLGFALGVMDLGRLVWTEVTLDRAVQAAARCAVVNATTCGTDAGIQSYAAGQAWGMSVPTSSFTITRPACGVTVRAETSFAFTVPWPVNISSVQAAACYPV